MLNERLVNFEMKESQQDNQNEPDDSRRMSDGISPRKSDGEDEFAPQQRRRISLSKRKSVFTQMYSLDDKEIAARMIQSFWRQYATALERRTTIGFVAARLIHETAGAKTISLPANDTPRRDVLTSLADSVNALTSGEASGRGLNEVRSSQHRLEKRMELLEATVTQSHDLLQMLVVSISKQGVASSTRQG